jgi:PST family polysaccharide transporter
MLMTVAQAYSLGLLNGHRMINDLVKSQILGPLSVLILVVPMIYLVRGGAPSGFVLMLGAPAAVVAFAGLRAAKREGWLSELTGWKINLSDVRSFFQMSTVLLFTGLMGTGAQFFMSWLVARRLGLAEAGQYWTAWTLSMAYVTLLLGSLGTYYMPSLSRLTDGDERRTLMRNYLHITLVAMPVLVAGVIVIKPWVILGMFSHSLLPALHVMRWMLIGDLFKAVAWVMAFPMLAFKEMKWFFWTEVLFSLGLAVTASIWLALGGGIEGLGFIFLMLYVLYFIVMLIYIWSKHQFKWDERELASFVGGLMLILCLSAYTWQDESVKVAAAGLFIGLGSSFVWGALRVLKLGWKAPAIKDDCVHSNDIGGCGHGQ